MSREYEILFRSEKVLATGGNGWIKCLKTTPSEGSYYYREVGSSKSTQGHFTIKKIIVDGDLPDNKIYFAITPVKNIDGVTQTRRSTSGIIPWCITEGRGFGSQQDLLEFLKRVGYGVVQTGRDRILTNFIAENINIFENNL